MFIIVNCVSLNKKFQSDLEEAVMPQTPDRSQWGDPHIFLKIAPSHGPISTKPTTCLISRPIRLTIPNCTHIYSAILPQYTGMTATHTDQQMVVGYVR